MSPGPALPCFFETSAALTIITSFKGPSGVFKDLASLFEDMLAH